MLVSIRKRYLLFVMLACRVDSDAQSTFNC